MSKHVLVFNQYALPLSEPGGTRHAELFARVRGWTHTVIAGDRNHYTQLAYRSEASDFTLVPVPAVGAKQTSRAKTWAAYCAGALGAAVRGRRPDLVYASSPHLLTLLLGRLVASIYRTPFVVEIRDLWPESIAAAGMLSRESWLYRVLSSIEKYAVNSADAIVVVTTGWEKHLTDLGVSPSAITVVPNGADPDAFMPDSQDRAAARADFGFTGFTAVFAGAHGPKDGIDEIVAAARQLPDITFVLVGDGPVKAETIAAATEQRLNNLRFFDPVSKTDLPRLLSACDVGIHSVTPLPVFELGMSPNKLFDYLAAGLPVVSNAGGPVARLTHGSPAVVVDGPGTLADSLRQLRGNSPSEREGLRSVARRLITDHYSRARSADSLRALFDDLTGEGGRGDSRADSREAGRR